MTRQQGLLQIHFHRFRLFVTCCLCFFGRPSLAQVEDNQRKRQGNSARPQEADLVFAESTLDNASLSSSSHDTMVGSVSVWEHDLWNIDMQEQIPGAIIGTSRGYCRRALMADGMADCHWTLTIHIAATTNDNNANDSAVNGDTDADAATTESKIMIQGDATHLKWSDVAAATVDGLQTDETTTTVHTFAVVGGTGDYEGAAGSVDVKQYDMFRLYQVYLA